MKNREAIIKQAKGIMDEFIKALEKVGNTGSEPQEEQGVSTRKAEACRQEDGFRERMLGNAPAQKDGQIVAEKKNW